MMRANLYVYKEEQLIHLNLTLVIAVHLALLLNQTLRVNSKHQELFIVQQRQHHC